jgi:riboflavin synthase
MFTGIITDVGAVRAVEKPGDTRFVIETAYDTAGVAIGASIACSGPCLTVVDKGAGWFAVDVSAETLLRTTLGAWHQGTKVNLERPLQMGDELGGHMVTGHIDATAEIIVRQPDGASQRLQVRAPKEIMRYVAPRGAVALDGISLTVNDVEGDHFGVNIIPHTQVATGLGELQPGDSVNLEVDLVARYLDRLNVGA